jgi:hypothetical protein
MDTLKLPDALDVPAVEARRKLIDELGGTAAVARLFKISSPSVSEWKREGIPKARMQTIQLLRPDLVNELAAAAADDPDANRIVPVEGA